MARKMHFTKGATMTQEKYENKVKRVLASLAKQAVFGVTTCLVAFALTANTTRNARAESCLFVPVDDTAGSTNEQRRWHSFRPTGSNGQGPSQQRSGFDPDRKSHGLSVRSLFQLYWNETPDAWNGQRVITTSNTVTVRLNIDTEWYDYAPEPAENNKKWLKFKPFTTNIPDIDDKILHAIEHLEQRFGTRYNADQDALIWERLFDRAYTRPENPGDPTQFKSKEILVTAEPEKLFTWLTEVNADERLDCEFFVDIFNFPTQEPAIRNQDEWAAVIGAMIHLDPERFITGSLNTISPYLKDHTW